MGYYTRHIIKIIPPEEATIDNYVELIKVLNVVRGNPYYSARYHHNIIDDSNWNRGDGGKWYHFTEDIEKATKLFPDLIVEVQDIGESHLYSSYRKDYNNDATHHSFYRDGVMIESKVLTDEEIDKFDELYGNSGNPCILIESQ